MNSSRSTPTDDGLPPSLDPAGTGSKGKSGKQYYGKLAKVGALWSIMRQAGQEMIAIPSSFVLARLLTPEDFGISAAASFFVVLSARLTQFGFNAAIVRIKELRPEHSSSVFVVNLVLGVLTYTTILIAAPYIGMFLRSPEAGRLLPIAALTFLINPLGTVPSALLTRRMQFKLGAACDWVDTGITAAVTLWMAYHGYGYLSLVWGQLSGTIFQVLFKLYFAKWRPSLKVSRQALRELLGFGLGVQTKRLLEFATYNLDNMVVGRVLGVKEALGFYDKAFTTMNRIVKRLTLGNLYFRIFSIIHEEPIRFRRAYTRLVLTISIIGLPAFAAAIVSARQLILVLYGDQWLPTVLPFQMLCVGGMLKLLNEYASQANEATGNIWRQVVRQAIGTVSIVAGAWIGALLGGLAGAAIGVAVGMAVLTVSMQALVRQTTGLTWGEMLYPQIPAAACAGMMVAVLLAVAYALPMVVPNPAPWQLLLVQTVVGGVFYLLFILYSPFEDLGEIVTDSIHQLLPARVAQGLDRIRRLDRRALSPQS